MGQLDIDLSSWSGAEQAEVDEDGWITFWRLPPAAEPTIRSTDFWERARTPSGVAFRGGVNARAIEFEVCGVADASPVDVVVEGRLIDRLPVAEEPASHRVLLPQREVSLEVWLPQYGEVRLRNARLVDGTYRDSEYEKRWIAYGSSITQCRTADGPSETWPALVAREYRWSLTNLGFGGQCHLDPAILSVLTRHQADVISMCVGANIYGGSSFSARSLFPHLVDFVDRTLSAQDHAKVALISQIASPLAERRANAVGLTVEDIRQIVESSAELLSRRWGSRVAYVDGLEILSASVAPEMLSEDQLHPNPAGYAHMARSLGPILSAIAA